ncbi:MAG: leucyl/phenylalanyl-tRNA--protein transferase [Mailhella sp.]|nr:leucyl/phenylalanyl-tRNA--protein transferase [Mailhella sp.]
MPAGGPLVFPPAGSADGDGLVMAGGDLSPARLLLAYSRGIFPWYTEGQPILWWSLDPRCVLYPEKLHVPSSLRRVMNSGRFTFTENACFDRVMRACALVPRRGQEGSWITQEMVLAYARLHRMGHAHSVEVWEGGELAGGLYGVQTGRVFCGESMFHTVPDASKAAVVHLVEWLTRRGVALIDCQQTTEHMTRFGAEEISRGEYLDLLRSLS